jgi:L,D-peptidoglycan transpeptidase YkuD (ErfK/YbiS/YcfS/YnhG family)
MPNLFRNALPFILVICVVMPLQAEIEHADGDASLSTEGEIIASYLTKVETRLMPRFTFADVLWPPREVTLVAFKDTRAMEMWAKAEDGRWRHIKDYRIKGMSGRAGPKLREGDRQVPEGFYRIEALNPNSQFHLSMKLNYPNEFDLVRALEDQRENIGSDIFIHGKDVSTGCLAMGDNAVEELFVVAGLIGTEAVSVIISPKDFRFRPFSTLPTDLPDWAYLLSRDIAKRLEQFPLSEK